MVDLSILNLTKYEEAAYLTLVREGVSTATEVSRISKVPHGKIYPTLTSLEDKGLVKTFLGTPTRFMANPPKVVIDHFLHRKEIEMKEFQLKSQQLIKDLGTLTNSKQDEPLERIRVIEGYRNYLNLSVSLHETVSFSWYTISRLPLYQPHLDAYRACVKRGVEVRIITCITKENEKNISFWKKTGARIRAIDSLPGRFSVVDNTDVIIRISGEGQYLALWLKSQSFNKSSKAYFDYLWKDAREL